MTRADSRGLTLIVSILSCLSVIQTSNHVPTVAVSGQETAQTRETISVSKSTRGHKECELKEENGSVLTSTGEGYCGEDRKTPAEGSFEDSKLTKLEEDLIERIKEAEANYKKEKKQISDGNQQNSSCSYYLDVIQRDLSRFSAEGIAKNSLSLATNRGILYQIWKGQLYRQPSCNFPSRCAGVEHFIRKIIHGLPDMDLVINVSDWPQVPAGASSPSPVFSFSKNEDYADILYPAWTFWEGGPAISIYPRGIGRWDLMRKKLVGAADGTPWKQKKSIGFFRGSRTSAQRDPLILLSRKNPELVDAQYTKNQAWKSDADTLYATPAAEVTMEEHCAYKYLFNFRGVAASFRLKHLFLCGSLVFHADDSWIEFFYPSMKPWVHYVPLSGSPTEEEIRSLLQFFNAHEDLAEKISRRGYNFIKSRLRLSDVECYWNELLTRYSKLIKYDVEPRDNLILLR